MWHAGVHAVEGSRASARRFELPEPDRARRIGEIHADQRSRSFAELPIDLEEDPAAQALVVGELRELDRPRLSALLADLNRPSLFQGLLA